MVAYGRASTVERSITRSPVIGPVAVGDAWAMVPMVAPGPEGRRAPEPADGLAGLAFGEWPLAAPAERIADLDHAIPSRRDPVDMVAVDDDRTDVVTVMGGAVVVLDPGV